MAVLEFGLLCFSYAKGNGKYLALLSSNDLLDIQQVCQLCPSTARNMASQGPLC